MLFSSLYLTLIPLISILSNGLPLEGAPSPRALAPRAKSYSIVNVDGGSTSAPSETTTVVKEKTKTETVKITNAASTVTDTVTAIIVEPTPGPSSSLSANTTTTATEAVKPTVVTVVITETAGPTEYYDDGMWHTRYPVNTFETAVVASALSANSTVATSSTTPSPSV